MDEHCYEIEHKIACEKTENRTRKQNMCKEIEKHNIDERMGIYKIVNWNKNLSTSKECKGIIKRTVAEEEREKLNKTKDVESTEIIT